MCYRPRLLIIYLILAGVAALKSRRVQLQLWQKHLTGNKGGHCFPEGGPPKSELDNLKWVDMEEDDDEESILEIEGKTFILKSSPYNFFIPRQPLSIPNLRRCIVSWIVDSNSPFDTIERPSFRCLIRCATGSDEHDISSATIRRDIEEMHRHSLDRIKSMLKV